MYWGLPWGLPWGKVAVIRRLKKVLEDVTHLKTASEVARLDSVEVQTRLSSAAEATRLTSVDDQTRVKESETYEDYERL